MEGEGGIQEVRFLTGLYRAFASPVTDGATMAHMHAQMFTVVNYVPS